MSCQSAPGNTWNIISCDICRYVVHERMQLHIRVARDEQGRTDHLGTWALPKGPGSVGGPMRCPWYLS
ncbi:unnamed protein product [Staurois parvus]|uniref:Uncharacterized protein n=1 Tax=Staurois parvus TaxID=386267 RepID=A0ABN9FD36_9NEOB|nr:unnamed protein product [Staurois parvus]